MLLSSFFLYQSLSSVLLCIFRSLVNSISLSWIFKVCRPHSVTINFHTKPCDFMLHEFTESLRIQNIHITYSAYQYCKMFASMILLHFFILWIWDDFNGILILKLLDMNLRLLKLEMLTLKLFHVTDKQRKILLMAWSPILKRTICQRIQR